MSDILDSKGWPIREGYNVRMSTGRPRLGKVVKVTEKAIDVQTMRGLRTVRPTDCTVVKMVQRRESLNTRQRLDNVLAAASQKAPSRRTSSPKKEIP